MNPDVVGNQLPDFSGTAIPGPYSPVEWAILFDWFEIERPLQLRSVDLWSHLGIAMERGYGIPEIRGYTPAGRTYVSRAVATLVLTPVAHLLPSYGYKEDGQWHSSRGEAGRSRRNLGLTARHLFTIDWALTAPGVSWPEQYYAIYVPEFDSYVVTASNDHCDFDAFDRALGWFSGKEEPVTGSSRMIVDEWKRQMHDNYQMRWEMLFAEGLMSRGEAYALAEAVWPTEEKCEQGDVEDEERAETICVREATEGPSTSQNPPTPATESTPGVRRSKDSDRSAGENTAMSTTGPKMRKGAGSSIPQAPPDHPIYKRGFAIGMTRWIPPSKSTPGTTSPSSSEPLTPSSDQNLPDDGTDSTPAA